MLLASGSNEHTEDWRPELGQRRELHIDQRAEKATLNLMFCPGHSGISAGVPLKEPNLPCLTPCLSHLFTEEQGNSPASHTLLFFLGEHGAVVSLSGRKTSAFFPARCTWSWTRPGRRTSRAWAASGPGSCPSPPRRSAGVRGPPGWVRRIKGVFRGTGRVASHL